MTILEANGPLSAHQKSKLLATGLVNRHVTTRDKAVRDPLVAMMRRVNENVLGIRARRTAGLPVGPIHEMVLEAEKELRLDKSAQLLLGKLATDEPVAVSLTEAGIEGFMRSYSLPSILGRLIIDRVSIDYEPTARYMLHNIDGTDTPEDS